MIKNRFIRTILDVFQVPDIGHYIHFVKWCAAKMGADYFITNY